MESILIKFYSISDFYSKFCQVNRGISNNMEITLRCHHQLEKIGAFLSDSKCHVKQEGWTSRLDGSGTMSVRKGG